MVIFTKVIYSFPFKFNDLIKKYIIFAFEVKSNLCCEQLLDIKIFKNFRKAKQRMVDKEKYLNPNFSFLSYCPLKSPEEGIR